LWTERFRLLAIVAGVSVPLVIVYLIWLSSSKTELDAAEIIERVEEYALPHPESSDDPALPTPPARPDAAIDHANTAGGPDDIGT
jgi:hypothetical protein